MYKIINFFMIIVFAINICSLSTLANNNINNEEITKNFVNKIFENEKIIENIYNAEIKQNLVYDDETGEYYVESLYYDTEMPNGILNISEFDLDGVGNKEILIIKFKKEKEIYDDLINIQRSFILEIYKNTNGKISKIDAIDLVKFDNQNLFLTKIGIKKIGNNYYIYCNLKGEHRGGGWFNELKCLEYTNEKINVIVDSHSGCSAMDIEEYDYICQTIKKSKIYINNHDYSSIADIFFNCSKTFLDFDKNIIMLNTIENSPDYEKEPKNEEGLPCAICNHFIEHNTIFNNIIKTNKKP